jgi:hypothetical protein
MLASLLALVVSTQHPTQTPVLLILCCFAVLMQYGAVHLGKRVVRVAQVLVVLVPASASALRPCTMEVSQIVRGESLQLGSKTPCLADPMVENACCAESTPFRHWERLLSGTQRRSSISRARYSTLSWMHV